MPRKPKTVATRKPRFVPRVPPPSEEPRPDDRIRRLTEQQQRELLGMLPQSAVDKLAELVALFGAPQAGRIMLPADIVATLKAIADALNKASTSLEQTAIGVRTRIAYHLHDLRGDDVRKAPFMRFASNADFGSRIGGVSDALAETELHLLALKLAAENALADARTRGGRPAGRGCDLASQVRLIVLGAGAPIDTVWEKVLAIVIEAAELRREINAKRAIDSLLRVERLQARTNPAKKAVT